MSKRSWTIAALAGALLLGGCGETEEGLGEGAEALEAGVEESAGALEAGVEETGDAVGIAGWDADNDRRLASNEWGSAAEGEGWFDRWDSDAETGINAEEFGAGAVGIWDTDADQRIAETEWNEGVGNWYEDDSYGEFSDWDANNDDFLDAGELGEGFETTGLFGDWDVNENSLLEENEWNESVFSTWDANDDTFVDENEWRTGYAVWGV